MIGMLQMAPSQQILLGDKKTMKKVFFAFALLILSSGLLSCRSSAPPQNTFKEDFTLGRIIENNAHYLIPGARELFSSEYGSPEQPITQKQEEVAIQVEPANLPIFLATIQSDIEKSVINSGASIIGHGSGGGTGTPFSIQYRESEGFGIINVWGARGEGTNFFLIVLITENKIHD